MIYPKGIKLNPGNYIDNRVLKTDKLRTFNYELCSHLKLFIQSLEQQMKAQELISKDLEYVYQGYTIYEPLLVDLQKAVQHRQDILRKEITDIRNVLTKTKDLEKEFKPIKPFVKKYYEKDNKLKHYNEKLPKLKVQMDAKTKLKGELSRKDTKKLIRNEKKLKDAQTETEISAQKIIEESNRINLDRFKWTNPILQEYISLLLADCYMNQENYHKLDNYENILAQKQTEDFNERFFLNVKEQSKVHYKGVKPIKAQPGVYKKNVQNNYYYVNSDTQSNPQQQAYPMPDQQRLNQNQQPSQVNGQYQQLQYQQNALPPNQQNALPPNQQYALPPNQQYALPPNQQQPSQIQQNIQQAIPLPPNSQQFNLIYK